VNISAVLANQGNITIEMYDAIGNLSQTNVNSVSTSLNMDNMAKEIYFIKLKTNESMIMNKLIVQ
jgi:hypothetical protein